MTDFAAITAKVGEAAIQDSEEKAAPADGAFSAGFFNASGIFARLAGGESVVAGTTMTADSSFECAGATDTSCDSAIDAGSATVSATHCAGSVVFYCG